MRREPTSIIPDDEYLRGRERTQETGKIYKNRLAAFLATLNSETDPLNSIRMQTEYTAQKLAEIFSWPLEDGLEYFLATIRSHRGLAVECKKNSNGEYIFFPKSKASTQKWVDLPYNYIHRKK